MTNLFLLFTQPLERAQLTYMVTGSVAGIIYGEPRLTHDVDVLVLLETDADARALANVFPEDEFYCAPVEVINVERRRAVRGHFNIIHHETGFKADIYPIGRDPLHRWALTDRRQIELEEGDIWVAPPEYVIIRKMEYFKEGGSEKHMMDIAAMLRVSADDIDLGRIRQEAATRGLEEIWQRVLENVSS